MQNDAGAPSRLLMNGNNPTDDENTEPNGAARQHTMDNGDENTIVD